MKFIIPLEDNQDINSKISDHFGKARYFAIVNIEDNSINVEIVESPKYSGTRPGEYFSQMSINGVIVRCRIGLKAIELLKEKGIKIFSTDCDTLKCVVDEIRKGELKEFTGNVCYHRNGT